MVINRRFVVIAGYGFQIWDGPSAGDPSRPGRDFLCIGVYGQMIYVSPDDGVVVVKTAADPNYPELQVPGTHENALETQGYHAARAIARHVSAARTSRKGPKDFDRRSH